MKYNNTIGINTFEIGRGNIGIINYSFSKNYNKWNSCISIIYPNKSNGVY